MQTPVVDPDKWEHLLFFITHIFLPPELPQSSDDGLSQDEALARITSEIAREFLGKLSNDRHPPWIRMVEMVENLGRSVKHNALDPSEIWDQISSMSAGDVRVFMIRHQNAALMLRKSTTEVTFESFEISPGTSKVMKTKGKLITLYPGPAISVPLSVVEDSSFLETLSDFLSEMYKDTLDSKPKTTKAGSTIQETRDTVDPRYITDLLTGILHGLGQISDIPRIQKRIADDVLWSDTEFPWRRSPLWLLIRVALQTSLHRVFGDHSDYKTFILFFMTRLLRIALSRLPDLQSELLFCMQKKIAWRLNKLRAIVPEFVFNSVKGVTDDVQSVLGKRWGSIQAEQARRPLWQPKMLNIREDTTLSLNTSRLYLQRVIQNQTAPSPNPLFDPEDASRFLTFAEYVQPHFRAFEADGFMLADFEHAVCDTLDDWVEANINRESACSSIAGIMKEYTKTAPSSYRSNPESSSLMLLTIAELWIALDRIVIHHLPLLERYSPEIPSCLFDSLLMRKGEELSRLSRIQTYLENRHHRRGHGPNLSIFSKKISEVTFSICYFNASLHLQHKLRAIEEEAERTRNRKREELGQKNTAYRTFKKQDEDNAHTCYYDYRSRFVRNGCVKCQLQDQMKALSIDVHEWPLPTSDLEAKSVVFELNCPLAFRAWRDTTYAFLHDLCMKNTPSSVGPPVVLRDYKGLGTSQHLDSRITLASSTKPFVKSHYRQLKGRWPLNDDEICVNNGLKWAMYDSFTDSWVGDDSKKSSIVHHCTFQVPYGPYKQLQFSIESTLHTSNEVIASQSDCPPQLNIHEYLAFGCLRSGPLLQWINILREVRARSLSFDRQEVYMLLTQSSSQVGPLLNSGEREWHTVLHDLKFGTVLLGELEDLFNSIKANWASRIAMQTIITLTLRFLVSATEKSSIESAYSLLRNARVATGHWIFELRQALQETTDEQEVREFQSLLVEVATICRQTYDVSSVHLQPLMHSAKDIEDYIFCAIIIYDNTLSRSSSDPSGLLARDRRLSFRLEPTICSYILQSQEGRTGLSGAIRQVWDGYKPGSDWRQLLSSKSSWFFSSTACDGHQLSQSVHYNLLEGRLLIAGKPVGRLPRNITEHPTYKKILGNVTPFHNLNKKYSNSSCGQRILDVIPADMPGMDFSTRGKIFAYHLYFVLCETDNELIVRARTGDQTLELIPLHHLEGDFPYLFVKKHVPWMNIETHEIEFRPVDNTWESSSDNWRLHFARGGSSTLSKPGLTLIDIRSPTAKMVSEQLESIESRRHHIITCSSKSPFKLSVNLPRLGLSFFLDENQDLQSKNFLSMVVDDDQSSGTMFGLRNQLLLRPTNPAAQHDLPLSRMVLIPDGKVSVQRHGYHVYVSIDTNTVEPIVKFHQYRIDKDLRRLVGNFSLINKLFRAYIHAVTSHCLPDRLLGHTGTEEAILELNSSGCQSFQSLEPAEYALIDYIASLVPTREFYPAHLKVMQRVHTSSIPILSRHYDLYETSKSIIDHATRLQIFNQPSDTSQCSFHFRTDAEVYLLQRAALRNALYYWNGYISELPQLVTDPVSQSRDLPSTDEARVFSFSSLVYSWPDKLNTASNLLEQMKSWGKVAGAVEQISLKYRNHSWLQRRLADIWLPWYNSCQTVSKDNHRYPIIFALSTMAYSSPENRELLPTLLAFATVSKFKSWIPPTYAIYDLTDGFEPTKSTVLNIIRSNRHYDGSPESTIQQHYWESKSELHRRRVREFQAECERQEMDMVDELLKYWPCERPPELHTWKYSSRFSVEDIKKKLDGLFQSCYGNWRLQEHIKMVQDGLNGCRVQDSPDRLQVPHYIITPASPYLGSSIRHETMHDLFLRLAAPSIGFIPYMLERQQPQGQHTSGPSNSSRKSLTSLISEFRDKGDVFFKRYGDELESSRMRLESEIRATPFSSLPDNMDDLMDELVSYRDSLQAYVQTFVIERLEMSLEASQPVDYVLWQAGLWPRITLRSILRNLASTSSQRLPPSWRETLTSAGMALVLYQQSNRLISFCMNGNQDELAKELSNMPHGLYSALNPEVIGDWLLIQIECNLRIREVQMSVAREMISPLSRKNTSLQLNMGEGKSSVIIPLVATSLADGTKLVRIVVLRSLSRQMFQLLVDRLGGLVNRRIYYMPFSRNIKLGPQEALAIHNMHKECLVKGGVLIVQPDHLLSYKLMSVDRLSSPTTSSEQQVAQILLESQLWLGKNSRDVIDEADEVLNVRYQLLYSIGSQSTLEDSPYRWLLIQEVLRLVESHAAGSKLDFPGGMQLEHCDDGGFPVIRFLLDQAADGLLSRIAEDIVHGLPSFNIQFVPLEVKKSVFEIMTVTSPAERHISIARDYFGDNLLWHRLLLLRGLLVGGILRYAFKEKRWRVDYGLDSRRTMLAVPYRAKDVPASRAEFSHPDVMILLTCLCYYYAGLTESQLWTCFDLLDKTDNPEQEYETWVREFDSVLPTLKKLSGVNLASSEQRQQLICTFRRNSAVINFFLCHVVFPREGKQFPKKIATSSWDIAEKKDHAVTTGFSGTNDGQYLLPLSIEQRDPDHQLGTNAKVLGHLLHEDNNYYVPAFGLNGERLSARLFIDHLVKQKPEVRVLLDVGAQMLELRNHEFAVNWLKQEMTAKGVIFFDDNDNLAVLSRDGVVEPFVSSPLSQQVDKCLLYLDDAHTRGTDIKLPSGFRAAVTLGPKVTKDRLVQGCMRMRKLGSGHTVIFYAPAEVDRSIRQAAGKKDGERVEVIDILRWVMLETCSQIKYHAPQWVQQGIDHKKRSIAWRNFVADTGSTKSLASSWVSQEARSLEELYSPNQSVHDINLDSYPELRKKCEQLGVVALTTGLDEEEEREVTYEMEREHQVERPPRAIPAKPAVHPDVLHFVSNGLIPPGSTAFRSAFALFKSLSAEEQKAWGSQIFTTKDCAITIESRVHDNVEEYLNAVNWILSSMKSSHLVIISPYEANKLLPSIRLSNAVNLHVYTPRVLQGMESCEDLTLYCIPALPRSWSPPKQDVIDQLNLLAGQLYFEDYDKYLHTCRFLGLYTMDLDEFGEFDVQSDGFVKLKNRRGLIDSPFLNNQLPFLRTLIAARRKGVEYSRTHVGKILSSKPLHKEDFKPSKQ